MASTVSGLATDTGASETSFEHRVALLPATILAARWLAWLLALAFMASGVADDFAGAESVFLLLAFGQNAAATWLTLRRVPTAGRSSAATDPLLLLSVVDMTLAMLAVYFTGGMDSPFYLFAVSTLLTPASALGFAGMLLVTGMFLAGYVLTLSTTDANLHAPQEGAGPRSFAVFLAVPFALAMLVQLLAATARRLEREEQRLAEALEENLRLQPLRDELATQRKRAHRARAARWALAVRVHALAEPRGDGRVRSWTIRACVRGWRRSSCWRGTFCSKCDSTSSTCVRSWRRRPACRRRCRVRPANSRPSPDCRCRWKSAATRASLPVAQRAALYRISQEALANVYRHAQASQASVTVSFAPDEVVLEIVDDGTGVAGGAGSGTGLRGIKERVAALAGSAEIGPAPGRGHIGPSSPSPHEPVSRSASSSSTTIRSCGPASERH